MFEICIRENPRLELTTGSWSMSNALRAQSQSDCPDCPVGIDDGLLLSSDRHTRHLLRKFGKSRKPASQRHIAI